MAVLLLVSVVVPFVTLWLIVLIHWGNKTNVNVTEDEHAVLFTSYNKDEIARLGVDSHNCAVLDSACSCTVCGKLWLDGYLKSVDKEDQNKVYQTEGVNIIKFGGGTRLKLEGV